MVEVTGDRKRAALWTIGRGSRGLLRFSNGNKSYVVAGNTIAKGSNRVHILHADEEQNAFKPIRVYATEAEVWSMELVTVKEYSLTVIAVTRRRQRSSAEIWSLSLDDAQVVRSAYGSPGSSVDETPISIDTKCSVDLPGNAIKIKRCSSDQWQYLAITQSNAAVLNVTESLNVSVSVLWKCDALMDTSDESKFVDGGWITDRLVFAASHRAVTINDSKTGRTEALLKPSDVTRKPATNPDVTWIPPFISRITSTCYGRNGVLYVGGQDGSLRAFDIRRAADLSDLSESDAQKWVSLDPTGSSDEGKGMMSQIRWETEKGHNQWVSLLCPMPNGGVLSGDVDGVVRCWDEDGSPLGTFPQHVDTVTSATVSAQSFVTISYDGRIALNQIPVGALRNKLLFRNHG